MCPEMLMVCVELEDEGVLELNHKKKWEKAEGW